MLLIFLLCFGSCSGLASEDYSTREQTVQHLKTLGAAAWPALLLATESADPEVRNRVWPLLSEFRSQRRIQQSLEMLDNGWPLSIAEAQDLAEDYLRWKALAVAISSRDSLGQHSTLDPDNNFWTYNYDHWQQLQEQVNRVKSEFGQPFSWPFN